ncbi:MAG: putative toxin-antitoxin system toxin component, PIN family [Clostridiales bacterium]|nr:putative toxin-antitoxin system toxin component, PIN family [Clostridiales bacterium]
MRIMLDTNVLISVFIFKSMSLEQLLNTICLRHTLVLSSYVIGELYEVIERKFPGKTELLDVFLSRIPYELEHTPHNIPDHNLFTIRDNQDEKVLYSAITADVEILITGDKDFMDVDIEKPVILTPAQFLERY